MQIKIVFYSLYGHVYQMAEAVAKGARQVTGAAVEVYQVKETLSDEVLQKMGAVDAKKAFEHVPIIEAEQLAEADAIIFGTPTRYGNLCGQMQQFLDSTGGLWKEGKLVGKVGSVFASTASQHGGQETTIRSFHTTLLHHGMVIVGVPYSCEGLTEMDEVSGGTPYGATTMADTDGSRMPSANELSIATFQGKHVAEITSKLAKT